MSNFKKHKAITTYGDLSDKKISKSFWIGKADGYTSKWHINAKTALASCAPAASGEVQEKKRVGLRCRIGKDGSTLSVFRACHFLTFEHKTHTARLLSRQNNRNVICAEMRRAQRKEALYLNLRTTSLIISKTSLLSGHD